MIPLSPDADNYHQVLELFSNYVNDINHVINSIKKSILDILNVNLPQTDPVVHQNYASVSVHGKKTIDDLKRLASILRGYARSKQSQREEEAIRRSRIDNLSVSRQIQSRVSRESRINSEAAYPKNTQQDNYPSRRTSNQLVTFELSSHAHSPGNSPKNEQTASKLVNYRSLRSFSKNTEVNNIEKPHEKQAEINSRNSNQFDGSFSYKSSESLRKRTRTLEKECSSRLQEVIIETESRFKECLVKHESGMEEIIRRNSECLKILDVLKKGINGKKQKKKLKQGSEPKEESKKYVSRYQPMTASSRGEVVRNA